MVINSILSRYINWYLSQQEVRDSLGVDPAISGNFTSCSSAVGSAFRSNLDGYHPTYLYVAALLERGVRTLIYVGAYDWICNWVGNEKWTLALEWTGQEEFAKQELRDWKVDGDVAGKTRSAGKFTFATVAGAGHMVRLTFAISEGNDDLCRVQVPYDKPKEALELVKRWLAGSDL
jgi:carboxypeptidase C (cathepsin A)